MENVNVNVIWQYDQYLTGAAPRMSTCYFETQNASDPGRNSNLQNMAKDAALCVLRYAVEDLLRWTPRMMVDMFNGETIKKMKLEVPIKVLNRDFPVQLDKKKDYYWYAHALYPDEIPVSDEALTIKTYRDLLSGKIKKLQKGFLEGTEGEERIRLCLKYYLSQIGVTSIKGLYYDFAKRGDKILAQCRLAAARRAHFDCAIDFLHVSLPTSQKDEFWYHYYKFKQYNLKSREYATRAKEKREREKEREEKARKRAEKNKEDVD